MNDKQFQKEMAEMFAQAISAALGIDLKEVNKAILEDKLKLYEEKEEYEKCAELRDRIKNLK
jgi:protein-arginine kinase activator protein McsA